jgi:hypothetical protein
MRVFSPLGAEERQYVHLAESSKAVNARLGSYERLEGPIYVILVMSINRVEQNV